MVVLVVAISGAVFAAGTPAATGAPAAIDWATFGFNRHRSGENPSESILGVGNAPNLHRLWSRALGGVIIGQPIVAAGVNIKGTAHTVAYVGDEQGHFAALDENDGSVLWEKTLPTKTIPNCGDVQDGVFGIGGTALLDHPANTVYVTAGDGSVHAFEIATGTERPGWPVHVFNAKRLTSYGGITADPGFTSLYVESASHCDFRPYSAGLAMIDVATHSVVKRFKPAGKSDGGGIWGPGGASYDPATNHLFVATGNSWNVPESYKYGENVVELDHDLKVVGSNYPGIPGFDVDFGATPIIYQRPGCPVQVAAENKTGVLVVYDEGHLSDGPVQRLQVAGSANGNFDGIPAYSKELHLLYVGNSSDSAEYTHGLVAFAVGADCMLTKAWNQTVGVNNTTTSPPTVAGGVVYFGDGFGGAEHAFNAATGAPLWDSDTQIAGSIYGAPTVVNGELLVGAWNGVLYAFGP